MAVLRPKRLKTFFDLKDFKILILDEAKFPFKIFINVVYSVVISRSWCY